MTKLTLKFEWSDLKSVVIKYLVHAFSFSLLMAMAQSHILHHDEIKPHCQLVASKMEHCNSEYLQGRFLHQEVLLKTPWVVLEMQK